MNFERDPNVRRQMYKRYLEERAKMHALQDAITSAEAAGDKAAAAMARAGVTASFYNDYGIYTGSSSERYATALLGYSDWLLELEDAYMERIASAGPNWAQCGFVCEDLASINADIRAVYESAYDRLSYYENY